MKKLFQLCGWLLLLMPGCKTVEKENITSLTENEINPPKNWENREVVELESGVFVETDGKNYHLQDDFTMQQGLPWDRLSPDVTVPLFRPLNSCPKWIDYGLITSTFHISPEVMCL